MRETSSSREKPTTVNSHGQEPNNGTIDPTSAPHDSRNLRHPTPAVVNLLLTLIYLDIAKNMKTPIAKLLPQIEWSNHYSDHISVCRLVMEVPEINSKRQITQAMSQSPSRVIGPQSFLSILCNTQGLNFIKATGDIKIPDLDFGIKQFILANPSCHAHHIAFRKKKRALERRLRKEGRTDESTSTLLFHGTKLSALPSILRKGFTGSEDTRFGYGLFMSELPRTSWNYIRGQPSWQGSRYGHYGLLIACEVLGQGRLVHDDSEVAGSRVHVITDLESIMPRYLFLVPTDYESGIPTRAQMVPTMLAANLKIEVGIHASYYEECEGEERFYEVIEDWEPVFRVVVGILMGGALVALALWGVWCGYSTLRSRFRYVPIAER